MFLMKISQIFLKKLPLASGVKILKYDVKTSLVAFEKSINIKSHPNQSSQIDKKSLLLAPYDFDDQCYLLEGEKKLYLLNRLDSPTSGIILATPSQELAVIIRDCFKKKVVQKTYHAIVKGCPAPVPKVWKDPIMYKNPLGKIRAILDPSSSKLAITTFKLLKKSASSMLFCLVEFHPKTGRTHQLRIQASLRKAPIVGDRIYGDFNFNKQMKIKTHQNRLFLHASALKLSYSFKGKKHIFQVNCQLPEAFEEILK